jgi:glutamate synthase (NADPH/NADH) large chain
VGVGTVAAGVAKAHSDHVLISGYDGGTGARPLSSIKHAGHPLGIGPGRNNKSWCKTDLARPYRGADRREMKTGRDVVIAALLGAEEFGFATAALIAKAAS